MHNLTFVNGQAQVVVAREDAWHRLGKKLDNCFSALDGMAQLALPEYVYKMPLFLPVLRNVDALSPTQIATAYLQAESGQFEVGQWDFKKIDHCATLDISQQQYASPLGFVGSGYGTIQIPKMFEVADALVGERLAVYDSMGSIDGGRKVFASLRLNELPGFELENGDHFDTYLNVVNSFDGSLAAQWYISHVRQVCQNTVSLSLAQGTNFLKVKHSSGAIDALDRQLETFAQIVVGNMQEMKGRLDFLNSKMASDDIIETVFTELFTPGNADDATGKVSTRRKHHIRDILGLYHSNDGNALPDEKGTMLNLLNSIVEYADFSAEVRVTAKSVTDNRQVLRSQSAVIGKGAMLKTQALDVISRLAVAADDKVHIAVPVTVELLTGEVVEEMQLVEIGVAEGENITEGEHYNPTPLETPLLASILDSLE